MKPYPVGPSLCIKTPYSQPEWIPIWAREEAEIDFANDPEAATRCTLCFAATELEAYLLRTIPDLTIRFSKEPEPGEFSICLSVDQPGEGQAYTLHPTHPGNDEAGGISIVGSGRTGLLYGAYAFLHLQGWRWFEPGIEGEVEPAPTDSLILPDAPIEESPDYTGGRGFDIQALSMDSANLLLWMARNRMDTAAYRPLTAPLARKLGIQFKNGGHIFEPMMDPDRRMPSGKTLWEEHPEWYGRPPEGSPAKEWALKRQFCVSQTDLIDFLAREIAQKLRGEWKEVDILAVWGFDTWGEVCQCPACEEKGNASDRMVFFAGELRRRLNEEPDRVGEGVRFASCAYEGTVTLEAPTRPVPRPLVEARDRVICYPIDRSYAYDFWDESSPRNQRYAMNLAGWLRQGKEHEVTIGEYYNVSKYEDLPLVFTSRIQNDLPRHFREGITGLTYMHPPLINWGTRALTHMLMATLSWDTGADCDALLDDYFTGRYGPHAADVRHAYDCLESAWRHIAEWRAWHGSVLRKLQAWDGTPPGAPLDCSDSFGSVESALAEADRALPLMREALEIVEGCLTTEQNQPESPTVAPEAVNPIIAQNFEARSDLYAKRLGEYRRHFSYGLYSMELMVGFLAYHQALYRQDDDAAEKEWSRIESAADRLELLWVPLSYHYPGPDLRVYDALTRTQLRVLLRNARRHRNRST